MIAAAARTTRLSMHASICVRRPAMDSSGRNGSSSHPSRMSMTCAFPYSRASSDAARWGDSGGLDEIMTSAHRARSCAFGDRSVAIVQPIVGSGIRWRPQPRRRDSLAMDGLLAATARLAQLVQTPRGSWMTTDCGEGIEEVPMADRLRISQLSAESHSANLERRRPP